MNNFNFLVSDFFVFGVVKIEKNKKVKSPLIPLSGGINTLLKGACCG
jgi:hypothetical protein